MSLWLTMASMFVALVVSVYVDYDLTNVIAVLGGFFAGQAAAYSSARSDDKLIDLVQRYVNADPEAIRQFAGRARPGSEAA